MAAVAPVLHLDNTFGALFIGVVVAGCLWGVTCSQTFMYYRNYTEDPLHLKVLVAAVWALDTAHQALITHTAYTYLVTHFSQIPFLFELVNSLVIEVFFNGFVTLLVQSFFARRVWVLSKKNWILTGLVASLILAEFVIVMIYAIKGVKFTKLIDLGNLKALSISVNALAAAGDVLIAIILCWMLQTSRTGFKTSDTMITKLIAFTINTGALTSVCAIASLITITALPAAFVYILFYFAIGRLYCNSLLATLNARKAIRSASGIEEFSMSATTANRLPVQTNKSFGNMGRQPTTMSIKVDTSREVDYDYEPESTISESKYNARSFLPGDADNRV